jgi:hypothetical protein
MQKLLTLKSTSRIISWSSFLVRAFVLDSCLWIFFFSVYFYATHRWRWIFCVFPNCIRKQQPKQSPCLISFASFRCDPHPTIACDVRVGV